VAITDFKLFNRSVPVGESFNGRTILDRSITETQAITLTHGDAIFSLEFAVLHYLSPGKNQYAYVMEGLEPAWNQVGNQHSITYSTLPPGDYTFRVMGANCDGVWSQASTDLKIHVLPPWWKRWWFRLGTTITLAGLIITAVRMRLGSLRKQNRLLEDTVAGRTRELAIANEALLEQSLTDPLTGLRNRRFLGACMPEDVAQIQRVQRDAAMNNLARMKLNIDVLFLMVDLDHFKLVNDRYGHRAGDMVLQQMGRILKSIARDSDTLVRWGGEEFLIVARNTARADAQILPERIRASVEAHPFEINEEKPIHCTCSVGFAVFPLLLNDVDSYQWEQVVELADTCLYAAKHGGRNAWVGMVPDASLALDQALPRVIPELIKSGLLPLVSSFQGPIQWEFKSDGPRSAPETDQSR
jgi:diguanylate cyclase (GGDEF)-like protein